MIIVYVTCKDDEEAKKIAKKLVEKKLAACGNFFPVKSVYMWNNKMVDDSETILILKTTKGRYDALEEEIKALHSYEVPCILSWEIEKGNKGYIEWVEKETWQKK